MSHFKPLLRPRAENDQQQFKRNKSAGLVILKDQLPIQVWLSLGAVANGILILLIGRIALAIPTVIILSRLVNALLIAFRLKSNPWKHGVVPGKFSAQLPNNDGTYGPQPAKDGLALLLIGTRSNHPLGLFAPGFKQMGDYMQAMQDDLHARADEFGLINVSRWTGNERSTGNDIMFAMHFRSADDIHRFAHGPIHREAWSWYNKMLSDKTQDYSHLSIWHEIVAAPAGSWETVYANSHPTLLGAGHVPVKSKGGEVEWHSTIVDASKGPLKSSRGRMARTDGKDNDKYGYGDLERAPAAEKLDL